MRVRSRLIFFFTLSFLVILASPVLGQTTWTGLFNADWGNFFNWTAGVPGAGTPTTINNVANDPIIGAATNAQTANLTINGGASVTLTAGGGSLTVNGALDCDGILTDNGRTIIVSGDVDFTGGTLTAAGSFIFNNAGNQSLDPAGETFHHIEKSNSGTLSITSPITASGTLTINGGTIVDVVANDFSFAGLTNGNIFRADGSQVTQNFTVMDTGSGTVEYYGAAGTIILSTFFNLTISGTQTISLANPIDANGILSITGPGTLDANGQQINVAGNWSNAGTFTHNNNLVVFDGAGSVTPGGSNFNNLMISAGARTGANGLVADATLTVSGGGLTITAGAVNVHTLTLSGGSLADTGATLTVTNGDFTINAVWSAYSGSAAVSVGTGDLQISAGSYTGSGAITVAGDIGLSGGTFNPTGTTGITGDLLVTGGVASTLANTLTATNASFTGAGVVNANNTFTLSGNLTMSAGTLDGSGTINVGGDVSLTNAAATFDGDGRTINVDGDWDETAAVFTAETGAGSGEVVFTTNAPGVRTVNPFYDLTINGSVVLDNALVVTRDLTIGGAGSLDVNVAGPYQVTVGRDWDNSAGGTFTERTGLVIFNGTGNTPAETFNNVEIAAGGTRTATGDWTVDGYLTISGGVFVAGANTHTVAGNWNNSVGTVAFTETNSNIHFTGTGNTSAETFNNLEIVAGAGTRTATGSWAVTGILTLTSGIWDAGNYRHTINGSWDSSGITFNAQTSTIALTGTGNIPNNEIFYNLEKAIGGTITLQSGVTVSNDLRFSAGILTGNGQIIRIQGDFDSDGTSAGVPGTYSGTYDSSVAGDKVQFYGSSDSYVYGANTFYNFICDEAVEASVVTAGNIGKRIFFHSGMTQVIITGGRFQVRGTSADPVSVAEEGEAVWPPTYSTSAITVTASTPAAGQEWVLNLPAGATLDMQRVDVWFSSASPATTAPPLSAPDYVAVHPNCINWLRAIYILGSYTRDIDSNGRIDIIEAVVPVNLDDVFTDTGSGVFSVNVTGYTVDYIDTGAGANDRIFWIHIVEGNTLDTDAKPTWAIINSGSLRDDAIGIYQVDHNPVPGPPEYPYDDADPIIAYTLNIAGRNDIFARFSETVYHNGGTAILAGDITPGGTLPAISSLQAISGSGLGSEELLITLAGPVPINDVLTGSTLTFANIDDNAPDPPPVNPVWPGLPTGLNTFLTAAHRVSDIGLGDTGNAIIQPVWAINDPVQRAAEGGVGRIEPLTDIINLGDFDGSGWLQDQDITMQVSSLAVLGTVPELWWDSSSYAASYTVNGFWYPVEIPGLLFSANSVIAGSELTPSVSAPPLYDYAISAADPKIVDGIDFEFFFLTVEGGNNLYHGRVEDSGTSDWYYGVRPFAFMIRDVREQAGRVTILSNVINPTRGEKTELYYIVGSEGLVTIQVFNLGGDLVEVLYRGSRSAGEYSTAWDGTNRFGDIVARGIYFIRVVGADFDEIRKVMVIK